ncbi:MAG: tetratricopeptide repeat protein [Prochlorococcus sp.]
MTKPAQDNSSAAETGFDQDNTMADRYYSMAETMNTRGAMELAVPFYRQAIALLLAERQDLRQEIAGVPSTTASNLPMDDLHGLLEAAQGLAQAQRPGNISAAEEKTSSSARITHQPDIDKPDLEGRIKELAEELNSGTANQVLAGLNVLGGEQGNLPASGLMLKGKAQMLQGERKKALASFEQALALAPEKTDIRINTGAARLTNGDGPGALKLLRQVYREGLDFLEASKQKAVLRNLASAESKAGVPEVALRLRLQWLRLDPNALPLDRWLGWAKAGLQKPVNNPERIEAIALLKELQKHSPDEVKVLEPLAIALEEQGEFREASLIYRKLLRPKAT